jgi:hypothetical protein
MQERSSGVSDVTDEIGFVFFGVVGLTQTVLLATNDLMVYDGICTE